MHDQTTKFRAIGLFALSLMFAIEGAHAQNCGLRNNGDGTLTDRDTGLEIQVCAEGQQWIGSEVCVGGIERYSWDSAVQGYSRGAWRLPTKGEAESFVAKTKGCGVWGTSWTSTPDSADGNNAWMAGYQVGLPGKSPRMSKLQVRLVRSGQLNDIQSPSPISRPDGQTDDPKTLGRGARGN